MSKAYVIGPAAALCVFIGVYSFHRGELREREAAKAAAAAAEQQARLEAEQEARRVAMAEAIKAAEQRKLEREAKEARENAERAARQLALEARDKAFREQEKTARQIERLKKELEAEQTLLDRLAEERRAAEAEKAFLVEFVAKAQTNVQALRGLLTRLEGPRPAATASGK
jgi:hypothetical protein